MTQKTRRFLQVIKENPGITTAELHRVVGCEYAHGHHRYTYDTVNRLFRNGTIAKVRSSNGRPGIGLQLLPPRLTM